MDLRDGIKQINFKSQALFFLKKLFCFDVLYFVWEKALCKLFGKQNHFSVQIHIKIQKMPHNSSIDVEFYGGKYLPLTTSHRKENQQNQFKYLDFLF